MHPMTDLSALIERVEAAEGPDRDLDYDIADAVLGSVKPPLRRGHCEKYTASADAALTVVPDGWGFTIVHHPGFPIQAAVREYQFSDGKYWTSGTMHQSGMVKAATPALAILSAALRTRLTQSTNEGKPR